MSNTSPDAVATERATAPEKQGGDFFSMFYLPSSSSQSFDEDVHLTTSTYIPFQGAASAASAVVGGILSAIDTAIAVMNEEFDNPSDSIVSSTTKEDEEDRESARGCCRKSNRSTKTPRGDSKLNTTANKDIILADSAELAENYEIDAHNRSIEQSRSQQEKGFFTPQNSLIGSISTLQLYEEGANEIPKPLMCKPNSDLMNEDDMKQIAENLGKDAMSSGFDMVKKEDSEYCIIRDERETTDGWLVVSDD